MWQGIFRERLLCVLFFCLSIASSSQSLSGVIGRSNQRSMDDEVATHDYHVELEMKLNAVFTSETVEIQIAKVMNQIDPTSRTETEAYRAVAGHLRTTSTE